MRGRKKYIESERDATRKFIYIYIHACVCVGTRACIYFYIFFPAARSHLFAFTFIRIVARGCARTSCFYLLSLFFLRRNVVRRVATLHRYNSRNDITYILYTIASVSLLIGAGLEYSE